MNNLMNNIFGIWDYMCSKMCKEMTSSFWSLFAALCLLPINNVVHSVESPLSHSCGLGSHESCKLYVSTIDGGLTALDASGVKLWSYDTQQPLFKSTLSYSEASGAAPNIIPGLNRALYQWDGIKLEILPFTADDLIDSTHLMEGRGLSLVGSKTKEVIGINVQNGKALYKCTPIRCYRYDNNSLIQRIDVLKVGISRVVVREANELTGEEMWNFTVGSLHLSLVEGIEDKFSCHTSALLPWKLQVDTVGGVLNAIDRSSSSQESVVWQTKLSSPIVDIWLHDGGRLERVQPVSLSAYPVDSPHLMLVNYDSRYYIQPVVGVTDHLSVATTKERLMVQQLESFSSRQRKALGSYNPIGVFYYALPTPTETDSFTESDAGTKSLTVYNNGFAQMCTAGPNGYAVYFYLEPSYSDYGTAEDNDSGEISTWDEAPPIPNKHGTLVSLAWSFTKYILFGAFVMILSHIRHHNRLRKLMSESNGNMNSENAFFPVLQPLCAVSGESIIANGSPKSPVSSPSSSTETLVGLNMSTDTIPEERPIPRFDSDYELKGHLGKGGFGIVYHVQNKLDGGEYAIKRIKLPTSKSAKEKVMREVHALARLDHPAIVRYFHSWVEKAPPGWTEMKEWMPLSRRASYAGESQSHTTHEVLNHHSNIICKEDGKRGNTRSLISLSQIGNTSLLSSEGFSPCPSFNSLNHSTIHSVLPPITASESRSSSFVIEFQDEGQHSYSGSQLGYYRSNQGGCFNRHLLDNRDDLSLSSACSDSIEDRERQDSITDLIAEPPTYLFIQMQLCQKESLKDWLSTNVLNRKKQMVMYFFEQTLEAVLYVHNKGMMHRDLKPSNIFFSLDGQVKVGDFGLVTGSVFANIGSSYLALKSLGDDHKQHTGNVGTHFYISPEQLSATKYNNKVDIFALGVIFFELLYPFSTQMERVQELDNIRNRKFPERFKTHLPLEADMVDWLMTPIASKRPSSEEVADSERLKALKDSYARAEVKLVPKL
ncbi:eukaryotic translation initiation factor 2-alpha kinase 3-like isoform X3 [Halichondria panicea]|uniref:eukaryotic translation initiation factor 2-alpha kinase 3-like isoform X3 n=1 Tax=Halichondria panicea TaxID=6063 RepID=UPI00312B61D6